MSVTVIAIIAVLSGIVARTLLPYLLAVRDNPDTTFDRKFLIPPLVSLVIGIIGSPFVFSLLTPEQIAAAGTLQGAALLFAAGYGTTDIVRDVQKVFTRPKAT